LRRGVLALSTCLFLAGCGQGPDIAGIQQQHPPSFAWILDRHGEVLQEVRVDFSTRQAAWVPLHAVAPAIKDAVIAHEDKRFYSHWGVDGLALMKAVFQNVKGDQRRGASTLTMQLAGFLNPELASGSRKGMFGKFRQWWAAWQLERSLTKEEILEAYLNLAPLRGEARGIGAASAMFFGKGASALTRDEALILVAMLPAPQATKEQVAGRACRYARVSTGSEACERLHKVAAGAFAPHGQLPSVQLASQLAANWKLAPGQQLKTSLDAALQRRVVSILDSQLSQLSEADVEDGAVLVLDNATGEVLAYVGSSSRSSQFHVDGVKAHRQAGSTLKPFLYSLAIERQWLTAASKLDDSPVAIHTPSGHYVPQNYDHRFKGPVSVRSALAGSLNIPAVRTLILSGIESFHERLLGLGLPLKEDGMFYGYALALGSPEVSLWSLTNAYRTLANDGYQSEAHFVPGKTSQSVEVIDPKASFIVSDILSDRAARGMTFGLENPLATPFWSAVKTGTSKDMRDNWCIGYTKRFTVGVWVGNFDGRPMRGVSGVTGAAPVWLEVMRLLHPKAPPPPSVPNGVLRVGNEWFIEGTEPKYVNQASVVSRKARITYPSNGMILALDPDMPGDVQRVYLQAEEGKGLKFVMNGKVLGPADRPLPWVPKAGTHTLQLRESSGQVSHEITIQVKG